MRRRWSMKSVLLGALLAAGFAMGATEQGKGSKPAQPPSQAMQVPEGVKAMLDIVYARPDGHPQMIDLYVPEKGKGPFPLIICVHGGAWEAGDRKNPRALPMTARGYAVAGIDYRLTQAAQWPAQIYDCKAAVRWLRAHAKEYNLDPNRFGVWGSSAGGHLSALLGTTDGVREFEGDLGNPNVSSRVQAVCDWCGPSDFIALSKGQKGSWNAPGSATFKLFGGPIRENLDQARQASPVTWVTKDAPPFLIMHGDKDTGVPFSQSQILADALRKAGVPVRLVPVAGGGHSFQNPETMQTAMDFFDEIFMARK